MPSVWNTDFIGVLSYFICVYNINWKFYQIFMILGMNQISSNMNYKVRFIQICFGLSAISSCNIITWDDLQGHYIYRWPKKKVIEINIKYKYHLFLCPFIFYYFILMLKNSGMTFHSVLSGTFSGSMYVYHAKFF